MSIRHLTSIQARIFPSIEETYVIGRHPRSHMAIRKVIGCHLIAGHTGE